MIEPVDNLETLDWDAEIETLPPRRTEQVMGRFTPKPMGGIDMPKTLANLRRFEEESRKVEVTCDQGICQMPFLFIDCATDYTGVEEWDD